MADGSNERRAFFREVAAAAFGVKQAAEEAMAEPARPALDAAVLVVGAGAIGSPVAHYLAGAGVRRLGIVDPADVELGDLASQPLHFTPDLGVPKVHSAVAKLGFLNPEIQIEPYQAPFGAAMLEGQDLVVDTAGVVEAGTVPVVAAGRGWVAVVPAGGCARCARGPAGAPAGPAAGVIGSLAAGAALRVLAGGAGEGHRLDVDLEVPSVTRRPLPHRPGCERCAAVP